MLRGHFASRSFRFLPGLRLRDGAHININSYSRRISKVSGAAKAKSSIEVFKPQILDTGRVTQVMVFPKLHIYEPEPIVFRNRKTDLFESSRP